MRTLSLLILFLQIRPDPVREHEMAELALRSRIRAAEQERALSVKLQQREFEKRFNELVKAVEAFAKDYNKTKGQTWPADRAKDLRTAMGRLQSVEPSLNPK